MLAKAFMDSSSGKTDMGETYVKTSRRWRVVNLNPSYRINRHFLPTNSCIRSWVYHVLEKSDRWTVPIEFLPHIISRTYEKTVGQVLWTTTGDGGSRSTTIPQPAQTHSGPSLARNPNFGCIKLE